MGDKKDPGKFTIRFNVADPQQRAAAELLNQQGRCIAQFLSNALLHYIRCSGILGGQATLKLHGEQIRYVEANALAQQQTQEVTQEHQQTLDNTLPLLNTDKDAILRTLSTFQQQKGEA